MKRWRRAATAALAAAIITGGVLWWAGRLIDSNHLTTFNDQVSTYQSDMQSQLAGYERILDGTQRLATSLSLNQTSWDDFFSGINFNQFPGLTSIVFSQKVTAAQKAAYQAKFYKIYPATSKPVYLPVTYLSPLTEELKPFLGYDSSSEAPDQYKWIQLAVDSGQKQRSDAYNFLADPRTFGMFEVTPVYNSSASLVDSVSRQQGLVGVLIGSFRISQLGAATVALPSAQSFNDVKLYDQLNGRLMYDSQAKPASTYPYHASFTVSFANRPVAVVVGEEADQIGQPLSSWWLIAIPLVAVLAAWLSIKRGRHEAI